MVSVKGKKRKAGKVAGGGPSDQLLFRTGTTHAGQLPWAPPYRPKVDGWRLLEGCHHLSSSFHLADLG